MVLGLLQVKVMKVLVESSIFCATLRPLKLRSLLIGTKSGILRKKSAPSTSLLGKRADIVSNFHT